MREQLIALPQSSLKRYIGKPTNAGRRNSYAVYGFTGEKTKN